MASSNTGAAKKSRGRAKKGTGTAKAQEKRPRGRPKGSTSSYTLTESALAQRREATALKKIVIDDEDKFNYNVRLINHIMQIQELRQQANKSDLNSLKSCFINYLKLCQTNGFPAQNLAAYSAMGFDHKSFDVWSKKDDPEIREFAAFVRSTCSMFREGMVSDGKLNPVIGIFWQRNYDGLRNDTEQVQAVNQQDENDELSNKAYKEKYKNLIGD